MLCARLFPDGAVFVDKPQAHRALDRAFARKAAHARRASCAAPLQCSHKGCAFIQHGQDRVCGLGRKHQHHPINARITVTF
jgi:hypothetical protein